MPIRVDRSLWSRVIPLTLAATLWTTAGSGQDVVTQMQSIDAYLMDEDFEIALAQSAAPENVSANARVLVLRRDGYAERRAGTNGFTCLVERSWSSPIGMHGDFFNARLRAPICYNAEAARTNLGDYLLRTEMALAGRSIPEIQSGIERAIATGRLRGPSGLAMSYMLSGGQLLGTQTGRFVPHIMVYARHATNDDVGHVPGAQCHACVFEHDGGPLAALVIPVSEFIDPPAAARSR